MCSPVLKEEDVLQAKPCRLAPETCIVEDMEGMYTSQMGQCLLQQAWTPVPGSGRSSGWKSFTRGRAGVGGDDGGVRAGVADRHQGPSAQLCALTFLGSFGEHAFDKPLTTAKVR